MQGGRGGAGQCTGQGLCVEMSQPPKKWVFLENQESGDIESQSGELERA